MIRECKILYELRMQNFKQLEIWIIKFVLPNFGPVYWCLTRYSKHYLLLVKCGGQWDETKSIST